MWRRAVASAVAFRRRLRRRLWGGRMESCHRVIGFGSRRVRRSESSRLTRAATNGESRSLTPLAKGASRFGMTVTGFRSRNWGVIGIRGMIRRYSRDWGADGGAGFLVRKVWAGF